nr:inositol monophosphatase family protein [Pseudoalteromonas phenolica]
MLATGFPFKQKHHIDAYTDAFKALFVHTADIRRAGSAALDMAYVAAGRIDGSSKSVLSLGTQQQVSYLSKKLAV